LRAQDRQNRAECNNRRWRGRCSPRCSLRCRAVRCACVRSAFLESRRTGKLPICMRLRRAPSVPGTLGCEGSLRAAAKKGTNEASHQSTDNGPLPRRYPRPCLAACSMSVAAPRIPSDSASNRFGPFGGEESPVLQSSRRLPPSSAFPHQWILQLLSSFAFCATSPPGTRHFLSCLWLNGPLPSAASQPTLLLVLRGKKSSAETRDACGRVAISSSADSPSVTGHGHTRTRGCDHLKLDRSLVKRPLHIYI
jgi:hypothetical protein